MQHGARQAPRPPSPTLGQPVWFGGLRALRTKDGLGSGRVSQARGRLGAGPCTRVPGWMPIPIREPEDQRGLGYSANGAVTLATAAAARPVRLGAEAQSRLCPGLHRSRGCTWKLKVSTGVCSDVSSVLLSTAV